MSVCVQCLNPRDCHFQCQRTSLSMIKAPPIVCLPLMRIPAPPEKPTKYLPEVWKPNG